ncbi:GNAT family N-acetyltransferase [Streptomyces sp. NRRL S-813]
MLAEILSHGFGRLGLQRVELGVFSRNTSAVRLYERLGFRRSTT